MTDRYREHRIPSPLGRLSGEAPMTDAQIRVMAVKAKQAYGVLVFSRADLHRLPEQAQAMIKAEHDKLYG